MRKQLLLLLFLLVPAAYAAPPRRVPAKTQVVLRDPHSVLSMKLHLEPGADVLPTAFLDDDETQGSRDLLILRAMQQAEGGYDAVNIYDRGILSWGIMQWSAHENSLQECLWFIKTRLINRGKGRVWATLFKENGLDVQQNGGEPAFFVGGPAAWRAVTGIENLRVIFRGTRTVGAYDAATVTRWAQIFARAGRVSLLQTYQNLWATRRLRGALNETVAEMRVRDITRGDLFSDALYFTFWTNNPAAARRHLAQAVAQARLVTGKQNPADWPASLFPLLWEQVGLATDFGTWHDRTQLTARLIGAGGMGRRVARTQLASRGWQLDVLRRGARPLSAQLWTKEPPIAAPQSAPRMSAIVSFVPEMNTLPMIAIPAPLTVLPLAPVVNPDALPRLSKSVPARTAKKRSPWFNKRKSRWFGTRKR